MSNWHKAYKNQSPRTQIILEDAFEEEMEIDRVNNKFRGQKNHKAIVEPTKARNTPGANVNLNSGANGLARIRKPFAFCPTMDELGDDATEDQKFIAFDCGSDFVHFKHGAGPITVTAPGTEVFLQNCATGNDPAYNGTTSGLRIVNSFAPGSGSVVFGSTPGTTQYSALGAPLTTEIPVLTGDLTPIKTWVATESAKEDGRFSKGECPDALTGAFSTLPRKTTTFYTYNKEDVIKAITRSGQPAHVQRTMYAFIRKEQPRFSFPNNNVAGIQTDGGMFAGTTIADYDYHTCYKDAVTWRAFAGFNNLDRGMKTFGMQIAGKYSTKFKKPEGTYEEMGDTLVWNYYRSWNIAATPTELDSLKATGQFTRGGKTYKKGWSKNVSYFAKEMKSFDDTVKALGT